MKKLYGNRVQLLSQFILLTGILLITPANAQENMSVGITLDSYSGYIWRGYVIGENNKAAIQPSIELGFGESGVTAGAWGSFFAQDRNALDGSDEIDLYADYSMTLSEESGVGISVGFVEYIFPNGSEGEKHTQEAYIGFSLDNALAPSITFNYDFGLFDVWYLVFSSGVDVPLGSEDGPALSLGGSIAVSDDGDKTGFHDITVTASVGFGAGSVSISPAIGFTYADTKINPDNSAFWGGVSIGFSP